MQCWERILDLHSLQEAHGRIQAESLAADGLKIGKAVEQIVIEVVRRAGFDKFLAELRLNVGVKSQQVENPRESVRSGICAREPAKIGVRAMSCEYKRGIDG